MPLTLPNLGREVLGIHPFSSAWWTSIYPFRFSPVHYLEKIGQIFQNVLGFPGGSVVKKKKKSTCHAGDAGSIPGWRRSLGGGNGNPLWYSCLENPMDREPCGLPVHGGLIVSDTTEHICTQNVLITSFSVKLTLLAFFLLLLEPQSSVLSQYLGLLGMYSVPNKCTYS